MPNGRLQRRQLRNRRKPRVDDAASCAELLLPVVPSESHPHQQSLVHSPTHAKKHGDVINRSCKPYECIPDRPYERSRIPDQLNSATIMMLFHCHRRPPRLDDCTDPWMYCVYVPPCYANAWLLRGSCVRPQGLHKQSNTELDPD